MWREINTNDRNKRVFDWLIIHKQKQVTSPHTLFANVVTPRFSVSALTCIDLLKCIPSNIESGPKKIQMPIIMEIRSILQ